MPAYIALLRGVNVGGRAKVAMADLRALLTELGFEDTCSVLNSGNLVFRGASRKPPELERALSSALQGRLGLISDVMIRTVPEWDGVVAGNLFPDEAQRDPGHLLVLFLNGAVSAAAVAALQGAIAGREIVRGSGRHIYAYYPDGVGRSKLTLPAIERALGTRATGRNWNTVLKIAALAGA
jgi:uncharacterized protein (DUF1697 family)